MKKVCVVVGSTGIGKTFLCKKLTNPQNFNFFKIATTSTILTDHEGNGLLLHDTGGKPAFDMLRFSAYRKPNIAYYLCCFSLVDKSSFVELSKKFIPEVKANTKKTKKAPLVLVGLKKDLVTTEPIIAMKEIKELIGSQNLFCFLEVSSKMSTNIEQLIGVLSSIGPGSLRLSRKELKKRSPGPKSLSPTKRSFGLFPFMKSNSKRTLLSNMNMSPILEEEIVTLDDGGKLHFAAFNGENFKVREYIHQGENVNSMNKYMWTPLHYACYKNRKFCVKELIECKDINCELYNNVGETPLTIAAKRGYSMVVKLLVESGKANMHLRNKNGVLPLDLSKDEETLKVFLVQHNKEKKFFQAVQEGNENKINLNLIDVNVNCINEKGENALQVALKKSNNEKVLDILFKHGFQLQKKACVEGGIYKDYLTNKYNLMKRKNVIMEIYQTEKAYLADIQLINDLFVLPIKARLQKLVKDTKAKNKIIELFNGITLIQKLNDVFCRKYERLLPSKKGDVNDHKEIVSLFKEIKIDYYLFFFQNQLTLEDEIKTVKSFAGLRNFIKIQEPKIPRPKDQRFFSLLSIFRFRLFKYKEFLFTLLKYTSDNEPELKLELQEAANSIQVKLSKFDKKVNDLQSRNEMIMISKSFRKKYDMKILLKNSKRRYVAHLTKMKIVKRFMEDSKFSKLKELDLFIFSDSIFLGENKKLNYFFYYDSKIIIVIHPELIRLIVHKGIKKERDLLLECKNPRALLRRLNLKFSSFYFQTKLLVIDHTLDISRISEFLRFTIDDPNPIKVKEQSLMFLQKKVENKQKELDEMNAQVNREKEKIVAMKKNKADRDEMERKRQEMLEKKKQEKIAEGKRKLEAFRLKVRGNTPKETRKESEYIPLKDVPITPREEKGLGQFKSLQNQMKTLKEEDKYGIHKTDDLGKIFGMGGPSKQFKSLKDQFEGGQLSKFEQLKKKLAMEKNENPSPDFNINKGPSKFSLMKGKFDMGLNGDLSAQVSEEEKKLEELLKLQKELENDLDSPPPDNGDNDNDDDDDDGPPPI